MIDRRRTLGPSSLASLRLGLPPSEADWGNMHSNSHTGGDAVRDTFDVRLQRP